MWTHHNETHFKAAVIRLVCLLLSPTPFNFSLLLSLVYWSKLSITVLERGAYCELSSQARLACLSVAAREKDELTKCLKLFKTRWDLGNKQPTVTLRSRPAARQPQRISYRLRKISLNQSLRLLRGWKWREFRRPNAVCLHWLCKERCSLIACLFPTLM